jgi:hypothetical protein
MAKESSRFNSESRRFCFERLEAKHLLAITLPGDFDNSRIVGGDDLRVWN